MLICLAAAPACTHGAPRPTAETRTLTISAQTELAPVARELAESFARGRAGLEVQVLAATASAASLTGGPARVALTTTPLTVTAALDQIEFARQPISVIVHQTNKVTHLSRDDLGLILTGSVTDWSQVGGEASPIMVLSREQSPLRSRVEELTLGPDRRLSPNSLLLPSDEAVAVTVARRSEAIAYVTGSAAPEGTRLVIVDGASPTELAGNRYYPLWQPVYLVTPAHQPADASAFAAYCRGRQGQRILAAWGFGRGADSQ